MISALSNDDKPSYKLHLPIHVSTCFQVVQSIYDHVETIEKSVCIHCTLCLLTNWQMQKLFSDLFSSQNNLWTVFK